MRRDTEELKRPKTEALFSKLCQVIPHGVNSPVRSFISVGQFPMVVESGFQDLIQDVDGHSYIDYCGSWGALIHGHAHPELLKAVWERMQKSTSFGITTRIEQQLAREVVKLLPSVEKIRFVSSGTEATMSAVRLARGYTGRDFIVKFIGHYHGHADFFLIQAGSSVFDLNSTSSSAGIPQELVKHTLCLPFNDPSALKALFSDPELSKKIAAVIVEPIAGNIGVVPPISGFLETLREETKKNGTLLIFDEVITGFRVGLQGAQGLYGITPDLTCLGKIIGGGFPAAAFGGRADIMNALAPAGGVYQAGTLSGNPVAMEAGVQALRLLQQGGVYEILEEKTRFLTDPIEQIIQSRELNLSLQRVGSMFTLFFGRKSVKNASEAKELDLDRYAHFFRYLFNNGVYIPPSQHEAWFVSTVHQKEHLEKTKDLIIDYLRSL